MSHRLSRLQKQVYIPAIVAIPARAAYCTTYTEAVYGPGSSPPQQTAYTDIDVTRVDFSNYSGVGFSWSYTPYTPKVVTTKTCYPAIVGRVGVPAHFDSLANFGWNAGARSVSPIPDDGFFAGTLPPSPVGVQFGLMHAGSIYDYAVMAHSMVLRHASLTIVEYGVVVAGPFVAAPEADVKIQRKGGVVSYWADGEELYSSEVGSAGEIYGGAVLYSVGDFVDSPTIGSLPLPIMFASVMPSLQFAIGETPQSFVRARAPAYQITARLDSVQGVINMRLVLPAPVVAISEQAELSMVRGTLSSPVLSAELVNGEEIPDNFIGLFSGPVLSAHLRTGGDTAFKSVMPLRVMVSESDSFLLVNAVLPSILRMNAIEPYLPADVMDGSEVCTASDWSLFESALILIAIDSLEVGGTADLVMVLELSGMDSLTIGEHVSFGSAVLMLAMEQVAINSHASSAKQQALQYAVNYLTGALTTYQDFDFAGFTQANGNAFAWNANGLYRLGADRDNGEVISALVDFGATDHGDAHLKRMNMAFIGVRTDGECYLRVTADDEVERVYKLVGGGNQKRAGLAKGVSSRYWNVSLELTDASFITVDNVELEVGVAQRRGQGGR